MRPLSVVALFCALWFLFSFRRDAKRSGESPGKWSLVGVATFYAAAFLSPIVVFFVAAPFVGANAGDLYQYSRDKSVDIVGLIALFGGCAAALWVRKKLRLSVVSRPDI
jgi:hypothetical protein